MNLYHLPFDMGDVIAGLLAITFSLLPFVLVLLILKWHQRGPSSRIASKRK